MRINMHPSRIHNLLFSGMIPDGFVLFIFFFVFDEGNLKTTLHDGMIIQFRLFPRGDTTVPYAAR